MPAMRLPCARADRRCLRALRLRSTLAARAIIRQPARVSTPVPERPTLDGLEEKWSAVWERDGTFRFDRRRAARAGVRDRHASSDGQRLAARRPRLLLHAHGSDRALQANARHGGLLSDGLGRQRPADRAARAKPLRRALRPVDRRTTPTSHRRPSRARSRWPSRDRTSSRSACTLTESDEQVFEQLWRTLGLSVDWSMTYTTIGPLAQRISQRGLPAACSRAGEAYQLEAPTLWDVDFQTAVAQAELEDRERPGRCTACASPGPAMAQPRSPVVDRDDPPGADRGLRRARGPPRRRAPA